MAASQAEKLKKPSRPDTLAAQAPPSTPVKQARQMKIRPRDLFPGSSIVASNPAARPTAIHAMMPIADSLGYRQNDEMTRAAVSHAGRIPAGE
jgi:hypothetical protein